MLSAAAGAVRKAVGSTPDKEESHDSKRTKMGDEEEVMFDGDGVDMKSMMCDMMRMMKSMEVKFDDVRTEVGQAKLSAAMAQTAAEQAVDATMQLEAKVVALDKATVKKEELVQLVKEAVRREVLDADFPKLVGLSGKGAGPGPSQAPASYGGKGGGKDAKQSEQKSRTIFFAILPQARRMPSSRSLFGTRWRR